MTELVFRVEFERLIPQVEFRNIDEFTEECYVEYLIGPKWEPRVRALVAEIQQLMESGKKPVRLQLVRRELCFRRDELLQVAKAWLESFSVKRALFNTLDGLEPAPQVIINWIESLPSAVVPELTGVNPELIAAGEQEFQRLMGEKKLQRHNNV